MNGQVDLSAHESVVKFGGKKFFTLDLAEWFIEDDISASFDSYQFNPGTRIEAFEFSGNPRTLSNSEQGLTSPELECCGVHKLIKQS